MFTSWEICMNKIFCIIFVCLFCSTPSVSAYTQQQMDAKVASYTVKIQKKLWIKLAQLSHLQKTQLLKKVNILIYKYQINKSISDTTKLKNMALLIALRDILQPKSVAL